MTKRWNRKPVLLAVVAITQFEIPLSVTADSGNFKFEIIAQTSTGNNTAIESCFIVQ